MPVDFHRFENSRADRRLQIPATARRVTILLWIASRTLAAMVLWASLGPLAWAGDWEDGYAAYMGGDYEIALGLFLSAAEQGNAQAMNMLSIMYSNGEGVTANYAEASLWSERADAQRDADAIEKAQGTNNAGSNK